MKKYLIVKEYIENRIANGTYVVERPLPPERELAVLLGVNRMTVRRAIEELMYDGYLIRKKGSGTYLTSEKIRKSKLLEAEEDDGQQSMRLVNCTFCREGSYGYRMLKLRGEEGCCRIRRVRYVQRIPFAYEDIYLRDSFFKNVDESYYAIGLHRMVMEKGEEKHPLMQQQVEALLCLKNTAELLNVKVDSPILQIKTSFYKPENEVMMLFCRSYHPGDSYIYQTQSLPVQL